MLRVEEYGILEDFMGGGSTKSVTELYLLLISLCS